MEYRLYSGEAIKSSLRIKNIAKTILGVLVMVVVPMFIISEGMTGYMEVVFVLFWTLMLTTTSISGWTISGNSFYFQFLLTNKRIKISNMEVAMVRKDSEWYPNWRTFGIGLPGLCLGYFSTANGNSVLMFEHLSCDKLLLIIAQDKFYIIGHIGVEKLYAELVKLGAQENLGIGRGRKFY